MIFESLPIVEALINMEVMEIMNEISTKVTSVLHPILRLKHSRRLFMGLQKTDKTGENPRILGFIIIFPSFASFFGHGRHSF